MLLCLNENHWHAYHSDSKKLDFSSELFFCWYGKSGSFLSTLLFVVLPKKEKGKEKKRLFLGNKITAGQIGDFLFTFFWELNPVA